MTASVTETDELSVLAPQVPVAGAGERVPSFDRRQARELRRRERRLRHLYALGGLAVLVALLVATVLVLDVVR